MKNVILAFFAAICIAATAAERISGVDSLAIGNLAGKDGSANRTVVIGSGAGAYMTGGDSNLFVGAAAGLRTKNVKSSVGLGHYAMRGATNLTRCVGIGDLAFKEAKDISDATWINGHLCVQGGRFFISPDRSKTWENAPFYFDGSRFKLLERPILNLSFDANGKIALFDGTNKIGIVAVEAENSYRVVAAWHEVDPFEEGAPITSRGTVEFRISGVQWNGNSVQFHLSGPNGQCDIDCKCDEWPFYISALPAAGINCNLKILGPGTIPPSWLLVGDTYWTIDEFHVFSY